MKKEVSEEGIKTPPRGVDPGDRWAVLEKTSPSGKTMFRCMSCGSEGPTPSKECWIQESTVGSAGPIMSRKPRIDCITWMPERLFRYKLPNDENREGWALIVLSNKGYFSAVSDYGNYAFYWSHHGYEDFRQFLLRAPRDWDYFASKLGSQRYDGEKTYDRVKTHILQTRRSRGLSSEDARREWELLKDHDRLYAESDFTRWVGETDLGEAYEFYGQSYPANLRAFCQKTLGRLAEILTRDLKGEGLYSDSMHPRTST